MGPRRHNSTDDRPWLPRAITERYKLTGAEHRVIALVIHGHTNGQIAALLGVSRNTVRNRLASCFAKLDVGRRTEAVSVLLLDFSRRPQLT